MSETLETVTTKKKPEPSAEQVAAEELVRRAREQGLPLTGPDGLLKQLTKVVIETALDQELTEHLGHERKPRQVTGPVTSATAPGPRRC
jgi:putative transposase